MNRTSLILVVTFILAIGLFSCNSRKETTQALVIGTIHAGHSDNPNYSYQDLVNILGTYNPAAICVEIPPSYFRKESYLKEMMIASIYGFDNNKKVYPVDWWSDTDDRAERAKYKQTDDYKVKEQEYDSLVAANAIMQDFTEKYGSLDSLWNANQMGYAFFNGKEYNDYIREMYTAVISVFGDGCMNLSSEKRNAKMMEMIDSAIAENKGKRVIILTGAEHKYYFDIALSQRKDVRLVDFAEILPLKETALSENIAAFIEKNLAKGYYDISDTSSIDVMYHGALIPLLHGMNMDDDPTVIPAENTQKAQPVIAEWEELNPSSVMLQFEKAWVKFLEKDYLQAIEISESIAERLNEIPTENQWFFNTFYWRNLGFCYDMTGQRKKAINAYQQGIKVCKELNLSERYAQSIFKDFEKEPYNIKAKY
ncbi:MAG: DUF5694 domain-containing protein [Prevotellaceae bacterium]|jgi:tetratricopeptide (TPR) repeat protein|nr:DUF5694 domain-containing protein [Prevotellaceae bacterium]